MPDLLSAERVHLVGIGGSGMAALASLLLQMGKRVSGSDAQPGAALDLLREKGAGIAIGHLAQNVGDVEYVVRSSAVAEDNPEVVAAAQGGIRTRKLAEAVGELMRGRAAVAVAGTHGKTTTTSLVGWLLEKGGLDPLVLVGADTPAFPLGARAGEGPMVVEADEYDRRFLEYWPEVAVVTSVEADHLDYFRDVSEIRSVFQELVDRLPHHGLLVACADEPCAAGLATQAQRSTYGFASESDWRIDEYAARQEEGGSRFALHSAGRAWSVESPLTGEHNARNLAAAIAVADYFGVGLRTCLAAIESFEGPRRRFETRGVVRGIRVVDDYGHHPTEVAATLKAARSATAGEVWVVFQPHTTNRTAALLEDFARALQSADHVVLLPIYKPTGREVAGREVTSTDLAARVDGAVVVELFEEAVRVVKNSAKAGDIVLTMGAGDVTKVSGMLLEALQA